MCPILYSSMEYSMKHVQSSPNAALPAATHCNYVSGVALTCQVKQNLIKFSLFSVLFNFVFQTSSIKKMTGSQFIFFILAIAISSSSQV